MVGFCISRKSRTVRVSRLLFACFEANVDQGRAVDHECSAKNVNSAIYVINHHHHIYRTSERASIPVDLGFCALTLSRAVVYPWSNLNNRDPKTAIEVVRFRQGNALHDNDTLSHRYNINIITRSIRQ